MQRKKKFRIPRKKIDGKGIADLQKRLDELHAQINAELAGRTLPDPADVIRQDREDRNKQLLNTLE